MKRDVNITIPGFHIVGWLFTIGAANLTFGQGLWAFIIWPYYLGRLIFG